MGPNLDIGEATLAIRYVCKRPKDKAVMTEMTATTAAASFVFSVYFYFHFFCFDCLLRM